MIVLDYIKNALFEHDCVIVAGFGGFLVEATTAEINPITNTFNAPSTSLAFNPSLKKDDGLLKSEISIGEGISLDHATELIKTFVAELENELSKNNTATQEGLGTFKQVESKLIFTPEIKSNFNIEGFGLSNFSFEPIITNEEDMKQVRPVPPARRVVRREPVKKEVVATEKTEGNNEESKTSFAKVFFIVLPILLVFGLGGFFGYKYLNKSHSENTVAEQNSKTVKTDEASLLSTDSSIEESTESVSTPISEENETVTEEIIEETKIPVETASYSTSSSSANKPYHVIGGVFSTRDNAQKFIDKHTGGEVLKIGSFYKVSVASYSSLDAALNDVPNLKSQYGSEIWVTKH